MQLVNDGYAKAWHNCTVTYNEGNYSTMMDFHTHPYYEVTLILTGKVRSLLKDRVVESEQPRLILTAPHTPHLMYLSEPSFYSRFNLYFSDEFVADYVPEWRSLSKTFGKCGNIILLTETQRELCRSMLLTVRDEVDPFRQRLHILTLLSHAASFDQQPRAHAKEHLPTCVIEALSYIESHYPERIVAHTLAWELGVGRTTLMTAFRAHTGTTLAEYILRVRVRKSIELLEQGLPQERVAEQVGLGNGSGLIRAFRHCYGMTPRQYVKSECSKEGENPIC